MGLGDVFGSEKGLTTIESTTYYNIFIVYIPHLSFPTHEYRGSMLWSIHARWPSSSDKKSLTPTWPNERITITSPEEMTSTHSGHFRKKHGHLDVNQKDSTLPLVAAAQALPVTEKKTGTSMECFKKSSWSWEKLKDLKGKSLGRK